MKINNIDEITSSENIERLYIEAKKSREKAYAPYSKFKVGSSVLTDDESIFSGSNVENAVYGATICAERTAIFKAVNEGYTVIRAIAIVADLMDDNILTKPCGICRQVLSEFGNNIEIFLADPTLVSREKSNLIDLFPQPFKLK